MTTSVDSAKAGVNDGPPRDGGSAASRHRFRSSREAEARVLLLIDEFSRGKRGRDRQLEGRLKLAKLDFLLRYPRHLRRVLENQKVPSEKLASLDVDEAPLDARMMRYRYGPWDPAYYAVLGSLIGRGLIVMVPLGSNRGYGYRTTDLGAGLAASLRVDESFWGIVARLKLLKTHLDKSGNTLKDYIYALPEISDANWFEELE